MATEEPIQTRRDSATDLIIAIPEPKVPATNENPTSDITSLVAASLDAAEDQATGACSPPHPTSIHQVPWSRMEGRYWIFKYRLDTMLERLCSILLSILEVVAGLILLMLVGIFFCIPFAVVSALGSISMLTGNAILRGRHTTDNASAAAIGALGALIIGLVLLVFYRIIARLAPSLYSYCMALKVIKIASVAVVTLSGVVGSSILRGLHIDIGPIDILDAMFAGAVGGVITGLVALLVTHIAIRCANST